MFTVMHLSVCVCVSLSFCACVCVRVCVCNWAYQFVHVCLFVSLYTHKVSMYLLQLHMNVINEIASGFHKAVKWMWLWMVLTFGKTLHKHCCVQGDTKMCSLFHQYLALWHGATILLLTGLLVSEDMQRVVDNRAERPGRQIWLV